MASNESVESPSWHQSGQNNWKSIMGGDGMQIQIDKRNSNIIYTGYQFGTYFRINNSTGKRTYIKPKHELGESPLRFNWQTPILLSPHNAALSLECRKRMAIEAAENINFFLSDKSSLNLNNIINKSEVGL